MKKEKNPIVLNRPVKEFRSGNIKAVVWENKKEFNGMETIFKTATLTRSYKRKDDNEWKNETINLRRLDLPKIITVLHKLQEELFLTEGGKND